MSIQFTEVIGPTGPIGNTGDAGAQGPTGPTGPDGGVTAASTVSSYGYAPYPDIKRNRFGYFVRCDTADDSILYSYNNSVVKELSATETYYGLLPSGKRISAASFAASYGSLFAVYFTYAQTTPRKVQLNILGSGDDSTIGYSTYTVWINGKETSSSNPLLWQAGSILLFAITSLAQFVGYLGNAQTASLNKTNLPLFHYSTTPSTFPVRPCLYQVGTSSTVYYISGQ